MSRDLAEAPEWQGTVAPNPAGPSPPPIQDHRHDPNPFWEEVISIWYNRNILSRNIFMFREVPSYDMQIAEDENDREQNDQEI